MATTSRTSDKTSQTSTICGESYNYDAFSHRKWLWSKNWKSCLWNLGTTRSGSLNLASVDIIEDDSLAGAEMHSFLLSLGENSWVLPFADTSSSLTITHGVASHNAWR